MSLFLYQQIYKGLLKRMHDSKVDTEAEARRRVSEMRDEAKNHIKSLQAVFEDRIKLLKEQRVESYTSNDKFVRSFRLCDR